MTQYGHGLVIGKFYPYHAGHAHLVRTAEARCRTVTVLVVAHEVETIPLDVRVGWVAAGHPRARVLGGVDDNPVDFADPAVWDLHMAVFRELCPEPVDAVFSSEPYGAELARRFGAAHEPVDVARGTFPVSGTAVRADVPGHWSLLSPAVRGWLAARVIVLGAESTGTTTLAAALADRYGTRPVPEYGREYSETKVGPWRTPEFVHIATVQAAREDAAARVGGPVLIGDTDAFATGVWHERYVGGRAPAVEAVRAGREPVLYLLTGDDIPFVQDGWRDGEHLRGWMTEVFRERLDERGVPWVELTGDPSRRLAAAVAAVEAALPAWWRFADPVG